jgi:hypothetical protein
MDCLEFCKRRYCGLATLCILTMPEIRYLRLGFHHKKAFEIGFLAFYERLAQTAFAVLLALKHEGFREEQEWRLISLDSQLPARFRPGRFGIVPYCAVPLCKPGEKLGLANVYVGPNAAPELAKAAVQELVGQHTAFEDAGENHPA